jgi:hypothetical protein
MYQRVRERDLERERDLSYLWESEGYPRIRSDGLCSLPRYDGGGDGDCGRWERERLMMVL